MTRGAGDPGDDAMDARPDEAADETADVSCPWCGEMVAIALDPGGGPVQEYVEDCQVCCRPWNVRVVFGRDGHATVTATTDDDSGGDA